VRGKHTSEHQPQPRGNHHWGDAMHTDTDFIDVTDDREPVLPDTTEPIESAPEGF
jgi:hypothetical protein